MYTMPTIMPSAKVAPNTPNTSTTSSLGAARLDRAHSMTTSPHSHSSTTPKNIAARAAAPAAASGYAARAQKKKTVATSAAIRFLRDHDPTAAPLYPAASSLHSHQPTLSGGPVAQLS